MKNSITNRIEKQLNKFFESLNSKWVKVSFILSNLDLSHLLKNKPKKSPFNPESFIKLYLYRRIKVIRRRYPDLIKQLQDNQQEALDLGFYKENNKLILPKKRTFNKFIKDYVNKETKELLGEIISKILTIATNNKVVLDLEIIKKKVKEHNNKNKKLKQATKLIKKLIYPQIDLKIKQNGKFTTKDLLDVLVHVAQTHDFCNNGSITFKEINNKETPHGNTMMYHFNKLKSIDQIKETFDNVFDVIFSFAQKNYKELRRRQLDIAIDIHPIHYYGKSGSLFICAGKQDRGTNQFFKFLTCSIVVSGKRFCIDAIPVSRFDTLDNLVAQIIKRAKSKVNIRYAFLDREFDKPDVINVLKANKVKFVMPKIRSTTVKNYIRKSEDCKARIIKNFKIGDKTSVNLILVDDEDGIKRAFITNFDIPVQLTHYLYLLYGKRWGIETSYRNMDQDFKPRTTSNYYNIRLFYFLFTVCLYNLWILVNICVSLSLYGRVLNKPIITAKLFSIVLYRIQIEPNS